MNLNIVLYQLYHRFRDYFKLLSVRTPSPLTQVKRKKIGDYFLSDVLKSGKYFFKFVKVIYSVMEEIWFLLKIGRLAETILGIILKFLNEGPN